MLGSRLINTDDDVSLTWTPMKYYSSVFLVLEYFFAIISYNVSKPNGSTAIRVSTRRYSYVLPVAHHIIIVICGIMVYKIELARPVEYPRQLW